MKVISLLFFCFLFTGCASQPTIDKSFIDAPYQVIMVPHFTGDTANYVYKKIIEAFANKPKISFIGHQRILDASVSLGLGNNIHSAPRSDLYAIAKELGAQAIMLGQVKSGAMSISSSLQIYSSIQLDLIDVASGKTVTSEVVDEEMTLGEKGASLKTATHKIISQYESIFNALQHP